MTASTLHRMLLDAGLSVRQYPGWETRGGSWGRRKPIGQMVHHTAAPVPYPVDRLAGSLIKCNYNTKPDGTLWLVAFGACNYSSGSGSSRVLSEVLAGTPPTRNAVDRGLSDDTNGNPLFWNGEHDHAGLGGPLPAVQEATIVTATRVFNDYWALGPGNVISHAEWTARKRDPYWNGSLRAIEKIREQVALTPLEEDDMPGPASWTEDDWEVWNRKHQESQNSAPIGQSDLTHAQHIQNTHSYARQTWGKLAGADLDQVDEPALVAAVVDAIEDDGIATAVADEIDRRARERLG